MSAAASAASSGSAKPKGSNTLKANRRILMVALEKPTIAERLAIIEVALREELDVLVPGSKEFNQRLKDRGRQIIHLMPTKPSNEDIRSLPEKYRILFPPSSLPEELRSPASRSQTRRKRTRPPSPEAPSPPRSGSPNSGLGISWQLYPTHKYENNKYGNDVKAEFKTKPFIGTFCDPIGFSQHTGECTTDSFLQILMFADHWKAKTQPLLYNMTPEQFRERSAEVSSLLPVTVRQSALKDILKNMQMRFRLHYSMIGTLKNTLNEAECMVPFAYRTELANLFDDSSLTGILAQRKRRLSANLGTGIFASLKQLTKTDEINTMLIYFQVLLPFLGIMDYTPISRWRHNSTSSYKDLKPNYSHVAFYLVSSPIDPKTDPKTIKRSAGAHHATAIYMCDDKWVYYDDNRGVMEIQPVLMDDILNDVEPFNIYFSYVGDIIEFYKMNIETAADRKRRLRREKSRGMIGRSLLKWTQIGSDWEWSAYDGHNFIHTDKLYMFYNVIHIVTANRSVPHFAGTHFIDNQGLVPALPAPSAALPALPAPPPSALPALSASINSLREPRKAFENALGNAMNRGQRRVNNTTRRLENRIKNLGLNRQKNVNNTTRALEKRILELASGSATRN